MTKLTGAALDRALANALGVKSVHDCENWGEHMTEEDEEFQRLEREVEMRRMVVQPAAQPPLPVQEPVAWMSPSWIDPDTRGWQSDSFESIPIEGWLPVYTTLPLPVQRQPLTDEQLKMLNFLCGDGEWYGLRFGEPHPTKKGAFWWRTDLRRVFDDAPEAAHNIGEMT